MFTYWKPKFILAPRYQKRTFLLNVMKRLFWDIFIRPRHFFFLLNKTTSVASPSVHQERAKEKPPLLWWLSIMTINVRIRTEKKQNYLLLWQMPVDLSLAERIITNWNSICLHTTSTYILPALSSQFETKKTSIFPKSVLIHSPWLLKNPSKIWQ